VKVIIDTVSIQTFLWMKKMMKEQPATTIGFVNAE
jgi:hypothetical protein